MQVVLRVAGLKTCRIVRRVNRFVAEIVDVASNKHTLAHLSNTGRLEQYMVPGRNCFSIPINGRKLQYRVIAIEDPGYEYYALIDTFLQNRAFASAIEKGLLSYFQRCEVVKTGPRQGRSVFDFELKCNSSRVIVETKSAVYRGPRNEAMYPDAPTMRGSRHLRELLRLYSRGVKVALVFIAALPSPSCFRPFRERDPVFSTLLAEAVKRGVPIYSPSMAFSPHNSSVVLENEDIGLCVDGTEPAPH